MKTVGIIGGTGPESTIEYYRRIIAFYREQTQDDSSPSMIINSVDMQKLLKMVRANELAEMTAYLLYEIQRLARAGADFGLLSANTPHIVFDEVSRQSPIPLISIVEATCDAAKALGLKRVGLFGTTFTMKARFYQDVFSRAAITLVTPAQDEQDYIQDKYFSELVKNIIRPETHERLVKIASDMKERDGIQGLILGGTELSLILRDDTVAGIPSLDTTEIHVRAIVERLLS